MTSHTRVDQSVGGFSVVDIHAYVAYATDLVVGMWLTDDVDGDANPDIVLGVVDDTGVSVNVWPLWQSIRSISYTAVALAGPDGSRTDGASFTGSSLPEVVPVADLSGDGRADLLVRRGAILEARDFDGAALWATEAGYGTPSVPGDIDGDDGADVLVLGGFGCSFCDVEDEYGMTVVALDGATGGLLWAENVADGWIDLTPSPGGSGIDIHVRWWEYDDSDSVYVLHMVAIAAADGTTRWERTDREEDNSWLSFCGCADDLNGDGVSDLLTARYTWFVDDTEELTIYAVDGATGGDIFSAPSDGLTFPVTAGADLDGDDINDLAVSDWAYLGDDWITRIGARRGLDHATLWEHDDLDRYPGWPIGADLDGDGFGELVVVGARADDDGTGYITAFGPGGVVWDRSI